MTRQPTLPEPAVPARPRIGSVCTGYGGLDLAVLAVLGGRLVWCADPDRHVRAVLAARWPTVPDLGDITTLDWTRVPPVDVITAGFPCQSLSAAGRRAGITEGTPSGIWINIAHAIGVLRPNFVFVENVAAIRSKGLDRVLADLAALRYDTRWTCLRASDLGAPHRRDRFFLTAWPAARPDIDTTDLTDHPRPGSGAGSRPGQACGAAHAPGVRQPVLHRPMPRPTTRPQQADQPR